MAAPAPQLVVYNTLTRKKEPFQPLDPPRVGMYVCGLTVYDYAHIGHARTAVAFETIRRWLAFRGYDVTFIQNVTDVDDKIIDRAKELKVAPQAHAAKWTEICNADMARLGVSFPDVQPKVTEHIPHIIELTQMLLSRGMAYVAKDGSVYYRVKKKPDYGKLSNRSAEEMMAGARVDPAEGKEDPKDFALWKAAKPDEAPQWSATFEGREVKGRPGWHIECSAMGRTYLGDQFDIHGGGVDLVFPHHENEVAQSEGATGKAPFVKYWLHTGFLTVSGEKMSKSLKNFITIQDMLKQAEPEVIRFFYANTHYRSGIDYSPAAVEEAKRGLERLRRLLHELSKAAGIPAIFQQKVADESLLRASRQLQVEFEQAMDDDFNTREAVAALFRFATNANSSLPANPSNSARQLARSLLMRYGRVLTIFEETGKSVGRSDDTAEGKLIDLLLKVREEARKKKDFAVSDLVRDELNRLGYEIGDAATGSTWRKKA